MIIQKSSVLIYNRPLLWQLKHKDKIYFRKGAVAWDSENRLSPSSSLPPPAARLNSRALKVRSVGSLSSHKDPPSGPWMTPSNAHSMPSPLPSFFQANLTHRLQHQHHPSLSPVRRADKSPEAVPLMNGRELQTSGHSGGPQISSVLHGSATGGPTQLPWFNHTYPATRSSPNMNTAGSAARSKGRRVLMFESSADRSFLWQVLIISLCLCDFSHFTQV